MTSSRKCFYFNCGKNKRDFPNLNFHSFPKNEQNMKTWIIHSGKYTYYILLFTYFMLYFLITEQVITIIIIIYKYYIISYYEWK